MDSPFVLYCSVHPNNEETEKNIINALTIMNSLQTPGNGVLTYLFSKQDSNSNIEHFEIYLNEKDFWQHSSSPEFTKAYQLGFEKIENFSQITLGFGIPNDSNNMLKVVCDYLKSKYPIPIKNSFWGKLSKENPLNDLIIRIEHNDLSIIEKLISLSLNNSSILTSLGFNSLFNENYFTLFLHLTNINEINNLFNDYLILNSFLNSNLNQIKIYGNNENIILNAIEIFESLNYNNKVQNGIQLTGFIRQ